MPDYIDRLDPHQKKVALHPPLPLIVYAGAGAGKSTTIVARIVSQIEAGVVDPANIFATSFTKVAAKELQEKIEDIIGETALDMGTLHSLMFRLLNDERHAAGAERLNVCKEWQRKQFIQDLLGKPSKEYPLAVNIQADLGNVSATISNWKANLIHSHDERIAETLSEAPYGSDMWAAAKIYPMYEGLMTLKGLVDFDDMILKAHDLLSTNAGALARARERWQAFFVDEAQDISRGQHAIIRLLADPGLEPNITMVGDTRQALYRFTSAIPELMDEFETTYRGATRVDLTNNYRSTQQIVTTANQIAKALKLPDQTVKRPSGNKPLFIYTPDEHTQAREIVEYIGSLRDSGRQGSDMAILVRTNAQTAAIESEFVSAGLPYWCKNGGFFDRMEVGDIMAYLRLINDHSDADALTKIINRPTRYLGAAYVQQVVRNAANYDGDLVEAMRHTTHYASRKLWDKQLAAANKLADLIDMLSPDNGVEVSASFSIGKILVDTEYMDWLKTNSGVGGGLDDSKVENIDKLKEIASSRGAISNFLKFAEATSKLQVESGDATEIATFHSAKGREWPVVIMTNFTEGSIPHKRSIDSGFVEDERRIAYVGMTRARDQLVVTIPRTDPIKGEVLPSRFMRDVVIDADQIIDTALDADWKDLVGTV